MLGQNAVGVGQPLGFGLAVGRSVGMAERVKNQIFMPLSSQSIAKTPPPLDANPEPYEFVDESWTMQPSSPFVALKQSVEMTVPVSSVEESAADGCVQPSREWSVYRLFVARFTFSTISISPSFGQFGPCIQKAGQTEH